MIGVATEAQRLDEVLERYGTTPATAPDGLRVLAQLAAEIGVAFQRVPALTNADKLRLSRRIDELVVAAVTPNTWGHWVRAHRRGAVLGGASVGVAITVAAAAIGYVLVHDRRSGSVLRLVSRAAAS